MVLGMAVDSNVLSYPVLVSMKVQGAVIGRGGANPKPSGRSEPVLRRRARQSPPSDAGRGEASPRGSSKVEPALGGWARRSQSSVVRARSVVAFLSDRKRQRLIVISSNSLGTSILGPKQVARSIDWRRSEQLTSHTQVSDGACRTTTDRKLFDCDETRTVRPRNDRGTPFPSSSSSSSVVSSRI